MNVEGGFLWQKRLDSGADSRILTVIKNVYRKAKSCVKQRIFVKTVFIVIQVFALVKICHLYFLPSI